MWKLLVSLETEKTTTTCNFQTMAMNSFVVPHDLMRNQIGSYAYMQIWAYLFHDSRKVKKHPKKNIYTQQQKQNQAAISREKKIFYFENALFFPTIWLEKKKVDKVFLVKQQRNLVKTW